MSERQARLNRKAEPEKKQEKKKGSALANLIITVVILAFLGLGGYALKDKIKAMIPEKPEKVPTVSDMAKERDMSVEEFLAEFGLDGAQVTKDSTEQDLLSFFTVANYAKFEGKTTDELLAEYGIEGVTDDMLWQEAFQFVPMSKYAEMMGTTFEDMKTQSGLPETITEATTLKEAQEIMAEAQPAETEEPEAAAEAETEEAETEEEVKTEEDSE